MPLTHKQNPRSPGLTGRRVIGNGTEFSIILCIRSAVLRGGQQCILVGWALLYGPSLGRRSEHLCGGGTGLCNAQDSAWQQPTLKGFLSAWNRKQPAKHGGRAGLGRTEKASVKQLKELRSQWAARAAGDEEAEEMQSSPTQLNLLRDRPLPCEEEKETVTTETLTWWSPGKKS